MSDKLIIDMTGKKFGRLTVIRHCKRPKGYVNTLAWWLCVCECGTKKRVAGDKLRNGDTISCGCFRSAELAKGRRSLHEAIFSHGLSRTPEYTAWRHMLRRCCNKKDPVYSCYGGRGITVCKKWRDSFLAFLKDMGLRPKGNRRQWSIDRKENNGNYEPRNCRWVTKKEQANNTRGNRPVILDGKIVSQGEAAIILGITRKSVSRKLRKGKMSYANPA